MFVNEVCNKVLFSKLQLVVKLIQLNIIVVLMFKSFQFLQENVLLATLSRQNNAEEYMVKLQILLLVVFRIHFFFAKFNTYTYLYTYYNFFAFIVVSKCHFQVICSSHFLFIIFQYFLLNNYLLRVVLSPGVLKNHGYVKPK